MFLSLTGGFAQRTAGISREGAAIGFGCVMQVSGAGGQTGALPDMDGPDMDGLDMDERSFPSLVGEAGIARDRPQGGRSWSPPLPPNDRRGRSSANKQILGRARTTVLEGLAHSSQAT